MYIKVCNVKLYYTCIGTGRPLLLLHGNSEDHTIFTTLVESLSKHYTCYLIDTRGHGKSDPVNEYHYQDMMEDIHHFILELKLNNPYILGFSDGGIVGLILGNRYPHMVSKYIICGANLYPRGLKDIELLKMYVQYTFTRNKRIKMLLEEPSITQSDLMKIEAPVLIVTGSNDMIKETHTKEIVNGIRNVKEIVKVGYNHTNYIVNSDVLKEDIIEFFK